MINGKLLLSLTCISLLFRIAAAVGVVAVPMIASAQGGFTTVSPFTGTSSGQLIDAITAIVNALLTLAAVIAAIFIVIGGVRYITSQGDEDATAAAKDTVLYAVIGVIVIALSAVIVNFIINAIIIP